MIVCYYALFIHQVMSESTADYLLVAGHYPVYSVCDHGSSDLLISNLKPLLEKYQAHYLSGHVSQSTCASQYMCDISHIYTAYTCIYVYLSLINPPISLLRIIARSIYQKTM